MKNKAFAYLLWLIVGLIGGHRFYLGSPLGGAAYLLSLVVIGALPESLVLQIVSSCYFIYYLYDIYWIYQWKQPIANASGSVGTPTSFDKWKKLKEASSRAGEEFCFTEPVALSYTPAIPEEIDTPIGGLHDWLWDRGYYKEVRGGVWYEMYEAESRRPWNADDMHLDAVDEHGDYYWGQMMLFHAVMMDHYAEYGQITFFVPDGETFYTLDELSDSLA